RAVFKSLQESRPFSVDFFRKMIQFEKEQTESHSVAQAGLLAHCNLRFPGILQYGEHKRIL
ncbi:UTP6 isoform 8, partial [Pongo abelii]